MDSLIHYDAPDMAEMIARLSSCADRGMAFTFAPRTPLLNLIWLVGKAFPRSDRSPALEPISEKNLRERLTLVYNGYVANLFGRLERPEAFNKLREERDELIKRVETLSEFVDELVRTKQPGEAKPIKNLAQSDHREDVEQDEPERTDGLDVATLVEVPPHLKGNPKADIDREDCADEALPRFHSAILPRGGTR
jgi:hypothetical protein